MFSKSEKYNALIGLYTEMAHEGFERRKGDRVSPDAGYGVQEAAKFRRQLKSLFAHCGIRSVLDYGGGRTSWFDKEVPEGGSLADFVGISEYCIFEPAHALDQRSSVDAVVSFDVLEHIYLADVGYVLDEIFRLSDKLVVLNIAGYPANALLPTGENAHITLRSLDWWRGAIEVVSSAYPDIMVALYYSSAYNKVTQVPPFRFSDINREAGYVR
ncbi:class I SAM-dependent methyltransferase [Palleronia caenipelagi]|uniref:Class I SAM-dependent methyltransferase n=1 Tax=Palleronia caenipelagi TaxID=2489174 RepID=A0A547PK59_9RHOB|nr:class I SAM-dependent methyltransferase [Palleronia caenipelagi]TRD14404.1 class I SAM-dependent methyltransferase [Palleronia caenipelagi]